MLKKSAPSWRPIDKSIMLVRLEIPELSGVYGAPRIRAMLLIPLPLFTLLHIQVTPSIEDNQSSCEVYTSNAPLYISSI